MIDETSLRTALDDATAHLAAPAGLAGRARRAGQRRLHRRRLGAAAGATATVAALVPVAVALRGAPHRSPGRVGIAASGSPTDTAPSSPTATPTATPTNGSGRYADPPPAGRDCEAGGSGPATFAAYPNLLLLPAGQDVTDPAITAESPGCRPPHVALTLLRNDDTTGDTTQGLLVYGPDAPSATQAGYDNLTGSFDVQGHPADVMAIPAADGTNASWLVFWSGADGSQWEAQSDALSRSAVESVLNQLALDPAAGTATLPDAREAGWTVAPSATDIPAGPRGSFSVDWHDGGLDVSLLVLQEPDRTDQRLVTTLGWQRVTVNADPGVLGVDGSAAHLDWQAGDDATAELWVTGGTAADATRIAASIQRVSPSDPRLHP